VLKILHFWPFLSEQPLGNDRSSIAIKDYRTSAKAARDRQNQPLAELRLLDSRQRGTVSRCSIPEMLLLLTLTVRTDAGT